MSVPIGTLGTVKFPSGVTAGIVADHADGERDIIVHLFGNAASEAEGFESGSYPTKVGDQISDFQPAT